MAEGRNTASASPSRENIGAVIVTHQPGPELESLLRSTARQVSKVVIVDNQSRPEMIDWLQALVMEVDGLLQLNDINLGVAAGLNQGIRLIAEQSFSWVLLLDQDSTPDPEMVKELCDGYTRLDEPDETAILAPRIVEADTGRVSPFLTRHMGIFFRRRACGTAVFQEITAAITSGTLLRVAVFHALNGYREDFFIDYVDTEFCLRLQVNRWRLAGICPAILHHRLGKRTKTRIGPFLLYPTHHPPWRWYTIGRNRVQMLKTYAFRFPHWLAYECIASIFITLRMLLTEKERIAKLQSLLRGSWDGLRGWMGPPPSGI